MFASVKALLTGIIDYAGMFPPAKQPLDQAIRNYARYRTEPESWMLGRFICPAARLGELAHYLEELFLARPPFKISALGGRCNTVSEFVTNLRADLKIVNNFHESHMKFAAVDVYEVRMPDDFVGSNQQEQITLLSQLDNQSAQIIDLGAPTDFSIYFEVPFCQGWRQTIGAFGPIRRIGRLADGRDFIQADPSPRGIKIRCGGLEASAFPSPEEVAGAITSCRDKSMPLKATAGLHHPMRHFDPGVQAKMHGFLNVFTAGVLTFANRLTEIQAIIEDEDPKNFVFDDEGLRWKTHRARTAQIAAARREFITSFGSCSFDEPREDLRALGLLPEK